MKITTVFSAVLGVFWLGGCATEYAPVYSALTNAAGENSTEISGFIKDASVSKESLVHATLQTQYKEYREAHKQSGLKVDFELMDLGGGIKAYLPKHIEYRDEPEFETLVRAPVAPSAHPVWETINNGMRYFGWFGLGYLAADTIKAGYDAAGNTYQGLVNMENSYNKAGTAQEFNAAEQFQEGAYKTGVSEPSEEFPGLPEGFVAPGCSVESRAAGRC